MATSKTRSQREADTAVVDGAPELFVYCKGCGTQLQSRTKLSKPNAAEIVMMCPSCRETHGHSLMPTPGSPTYCYRCGGLEDIFIEPGASPATHHVCPTCLPDRAARYGAGDFVEPPKVVEETAS